MSRALLGLPPQPIEITSDIDFPTELQEAPVLDGHSTRLDGPGAAPSAIVCRVCLMQFASRRALNDHCRRSVTHERAVSAHRALAQESPTPAQGQKRARQADEEEGGDAEEQPQQPPLKKLKKAGHGEEKKKEEASLADAMPVLGRVLHIRTLEKDLQEVQDAIQMAHGHQHEMLAKLNVLQDQRSAARDEVERRQLQCEELERARKALDLQLTVARGHRNVEEQNAQERDREIHELVIHHTQLVAERTTNEAAVVTLRAALAKAKEALKADTSASAILDGIGGTDKLVEKTAASVRHLNEQFVALGVLDKAGADADPLGINAALVGETCFVCLEPLVMVRTPVILPCQHKGCYACVEKLAAAAQPSCPLCRAGFMPTEPARYVPPLPAFGAH